VKRALAFAAVLMATACKTVGPNYRLPQQAMVNAPTAQGRFVSAQNNPAVAEADLPDTWWRLYDDPKLDSLVRTALTANTDLRVAGVEIESDVGPPRRPGLGQ